MLKIKEGIFWVGYLDWDLRNFHGYSTPSGSTYNSYLILDKAPTLIDTVKYYGFEEFLRRIREVIQPSRIRYIISNHAEMDHSGTIPRLLEIAPGAEVVCSPQGELALKRHFKKDLKFKVVKTADTLNIGKYTLKFLLTPMVHWPDSMVTYLEEEKILFSNDAFGQHYASYERFADEVGLDIVLRESAKYYANIVMPYGEQVLKALSALESLPIEMVCPSHGLIWRNKKDIEKILTLYRKWANFETEDKAVIIYDTMWGSTQKIALKLFELLDKEAISVKLINLKNTDYSEAITEVLFSKFILIGSPILNNTLFPQVAGFLTYLKGLKPKKRFGFGFGSYGWSKLGFKFLEEAFQEAGIEPLCEGKYFQYVPSSEELDSLKEVVEKIKERRTDG